MSPPAPLAGGGRPPALRLRPLLLPILLALLFRALCYAAMTAAAVWAERRPAPGALPDLVLGALPYLDWVAHANYLLWLAAYLPLAAAFLFADPARWVRYMVTGGLVSLARGATIAMTGLGPPDPAHAGAGLAGRSAREAFVELLSPWAVFAHGSAQAYLTKDLFFSGHTATTFLLLLYLWPHRRLRVLALGAHALVVASVLLSRLHYSIDVAGAWAVTFAVYALREWIPRTPSSGAARA
ncbi:MAG TPA: phosphatase PAP2-related protein [Anaeromyxobacteraceae bacterium]|nr:phosphatase PAP2-related protein [Anaeromyxobacteraceae bacterium]